MRGDDALGITRQIIDGALRLLAEHMNIAATDYQQLVLADEILFELDESTIARLSNEVTEADTDTLRELMGKHLRRFYFYQVGLSLGVLLGYSPETDLLHIQHLGETYSNAFEEALPDRKTEVYQLPPVEDFVDNIIADGFEYPHYSVDGDGNAVVEWRRVWRANDAAGPRVVYETHRPACDGPAVTRHAPGGVVVLEEYVEHGRTHRADGPAMIQHNKDGATASEYYFRHGKLHRDDGPAVIEYDAHTAAIRFAAFYADGLEHRDGGPAWVSLGGDEHAIHLRYLHHGAEHRCGGLPSTITVGRSTSEVSYQFFEHGRPRIDAPACVSFDAFGNLVGEVWYRANDGSGFHPHREDGPAYWRIDFGRLQIDYHVNGRLHREDGPAHLTFDLDGRPSGAGWYRFGESHRDAGPSGVWYDGNGSWIETYCRNGIEHRDDGPSTVIHTADGLLSTNWATDGVDHQSPVKAGDWLKPPAPMNIPEPDLAFAREVLSRWRMGAAHG